MSEIADPYSPSALFRCDQGHGTFRRDQCAVRRGRLECPRCLYGARVVGTLRFAHPDTLTDEAKLRRSQALDELGALDGELL